MNAGLVLLLAGGAWWSAGLPWHAAAGVLIGLVIGLWTGSAGAHGGAGLALGSRGRATRAVAHDIHTLQQAFGVLKQQVGATIHTSETAVMSMMDRLNRVHANARDLRERILEAVRRSQALSSDSLSRAGEHGRAVASLAEHQVRVDAEQRQNLERVGAVAAQVRQLTPLATLIGDIARQTNLLAINASIEAARAGPEGAGFKVVAAEVRRLSVQTSEAARQITDGIGSAASAIDLQMQSSHEQAGDSAAVQLSEIAQHIQTMSDTLSDVVPYLDELSGHMNSGMQVVTLDIIDTLGDMQFQDINRQLLEQINGALTSLSEHFAQVYQLIDGTAPPPPMLLEELLTRWTADYVMHSQRVAHAQGTQTSARASAPTSASASQRDTEPEPETAAAPLQMATAMDPASSFSEHPPCVLVVDDSSTMRRSVTMTLELMGCRVVGAADGGEALRHLHSGLRPDLVLTDIVMPGMDGLQLIREARLLLRFTPIVALTTQGQQDRRDEGRAAGATAWLLKPTGGQELTSLVRRFLTMAPPRAA